MRDKMARLTLVVNGIIEQHKHTGGRRQYAGSTAAKFLLVAVLQVCNGATGENQRPWTFLKISLRGGEPRARFHALLAKIKWYIW